MTPDTAVLEVPLSTLDEDAEFAAAGRGERSSVTPDRDAYVAMQASPEFAELRRRLRGFIFPMTVVFMAWYFLYVLLADYAHEFMAQKVIGNINVGLLLGLGQFVSTFLITWAYVRFTNRTTDPIAERLRAELEGAGK